MFNKFVHSKNIYIFASWIIVAKTDILLWKNYLLHWFADVYSLERMILLRSQKPQKPLQRPPLPSLRRKNLGNTTELPRRYSGVTWEFRFCDTSISFNRFYTVLRAVTGVGNFVYIFFVISKKNSIFAIDFLY